MADERRADPEFDWKEARKAVEYERWSDRHEQARVRLVFLNDDRKAIARRIAACESELLLCRQELEKLDG